MTSQAESDSSRKRKICAAVGLITLAAAITAYSFSGGPRSASIDDAKMFYTVDDGATTFPDKASLVAPFDHAGKQAVQAIVFSADGGKTKIVGYLQRYNAETKKAIAANPKVALTANGIEVSKPGPAPSWVPVNSSAGMAIVHARTPAGANVEQVTP